MNWLVNQYRSNSQRVQKLSHYNITGDVNVFTYPTMSASCTVRRCPDVNTRSDDSDPGLRGGYTSSHPEWANIPAPVRPDAAARQAELAARQQAIAADIERLKARIATKPSDEKMKELHAKLQTAYDNYGWCPEVDLVFGRRDMTAMFKGQSTFLNH